MARPRAARHLKLLAASILAFAIGTACPANGQSVQTVAGGGTDDGRLATAVQLIEPWGIAVDAAGNVFFAENGTHRIRLVEKTTGKVQSVAGNGIGRFSGDGPALTSSLYQPTSLVLDRTGGLLVTDSMNFRLRRLDLATGWISTLAGGGTESAATDQVPATAVGLGFLDGLAVDGTGRVYFSDIGNGRVHRLDPRTGLLSLVVSGPAGFSGDGGPVGSATFNSPRGLALDAAGNLFIADQWNHRVRRVDASTGVVTTVAGNGSRARPTEGALALETGFDQPLGLAFERDGSLLVQDVTGLCRISAATGRISRLTEGLSFGAPLVLPSGEILVDASNSQIQVVRRIDPATGAAVVVAGGGVGGLGDGGPATAAVVPQPASAVRGPSGDLFVAESRGHRIRRVSGGVISTYAGTGVPGSAIDGAPRTATPVSGPRSLAVDRSGNLFATDLGGRILRFDAIAGTVRTIPLPSYGTDGRLAIGPADTLYVSDTWGHAIVRLDPATGQITPVAGNRTHGFSGDGGPATLASLADPMGIAFDAAGNLFIADSANYRIRRVDAVTGTITTVAGGGTRRDFPVPALEASLGFTWDVSPDGHGGLLISDVFFLYRLDLTTGLVRLASGGPLGSSGDGGPLQDATFTRIPSLSVDSTGNLFLPDQYANTVRAVFACVTVAPPSLSGPADGAIGVSTGPTLTWTPVSGAFRYDVYLGTTDPPATAAATDLAATTFTPLNLQPGTRYFWRVVAKGDPFCTPPSSATSTVRSFSTAAGCAPPSAPVLTAPANGASVPAADARLTWLPSAGAGTYDVFFGSANPPPLAATGQTVTSYIPSGLVPGGTYYWSVLAHAACDPQKSAASTVRSFRVGGVGCMPAGGFSLSAPADGATGVSPDVTLAWNASPGATSYDLYLGLTSSPPLYLSGLASTSLPQRGLLSGATYRWKVVARSACAPGATSQTATRAFTVRGTCSSPGTTSFTFLPPGGVGTGQTYVVAWSAAADLDTGGGYVVERSTSSSFSPVLDVVTTTSLFASFVAPGAGTLYHRVRAVPACDPAKAGPWSGGGTVTVVAAKPNVVFSRAPEAVVAGLGERLEDRRSTFALENVTSSPIQVIVSRQELSSVPFFTIADPAGGDAAFVTLEPRVPKLLEVRYSGPSTAIAGSFQGLVVVAATGAGLAVTPYAFVNLKVGASPDAVPTFRVNGVATEYAAFPGLNGDDAGRPPLSVDVLNPGPSPLELAAEVGPEVWLSLEPGWNATPIPPGASRTLRLSTRRSRAPNGSALPRYTYLTLRSKGGATSRLLVQDNDAPLLSSGRGASAVRPEASFLVPSVAHVTSALGNTFVSRLLLSNAGTEAVQAELVFTPASSDSSLVDGFDAAAMRRATVVVPPNDLVRLSDPLVLLFGLTPPASGTLEVRAPAARAGFLRVSSAVDAPSSKGGTFGFGMPAFRSGEGIRAGSTAAITAVASDAAERTNLILAETTGADAASVEVALVDRNGVTLGTEIVTVPRWGQRQLSRVVERLGGPTGSRAARLEVGVSAGGGTVAAVTTVVDNANDDAATFVARSVEDPASTARTLRPAWARATGTVKTLVPALVNGYQTFPSSAAPFTFRSVMGFTSLSSAEALFRLTYYDLASGTTASRDVRVPGRKTIEYTNVLEQLFGVGAGAKSQGPLFVESDPNGLLWCRVASSLTSGTIGDSFPVVPIPSEGLTGGGTARVVSIDGLEQSVDRARGTRSNLILNEVAGEPVTVVVSLWEAGNRTSPIAERDVPLAALEKVQLSTVFSELGLESEERRKDRTNVLCTVRAKAGGGLASAVVTTIDNRTGDTRNVALAPNGSGAVGVTIGF